MAAAEAEFSDGFSAAFATFAAEHATYATVDDVATVLGRPITDPAERAQVQAWLNYAELLIRAQIPDLDELVDQGVINKDAVVLVEASAVARMVRNPTGKVQEGVDDYSYRLSESARGGEIYITDAEWDLLLPAAARGDSFTITPWNHVAVEERARICSMPWERLP